MRKTMRIAFVAFLSLVSRPSGASGREKRWLPDLQWRTGSNWESGRPPVTDDRVVFPREMRHAVGMERTVDLRLAEIDLPNDGLLVLARDGKLEISDSRRSTGKATWAKEGHYFWADPENWSSRSEAAPHLERVPCQSDDVVLPGSDQTLSLLLPMREVSVRSIRLADAASPLARWQWDDLRYRPEFSRGRFSVRYSMYSCTNCQCQGESQADYLEEICAIQRPRCGYSTCEYPLQVEGHCCDYCGGRITLPRKTSLTIVQALASEAFADYDDKLSWYVRRAWNDDVEVLVREKGEYSEITSVEGIVHLRRTLEGEGFAILNVETSGAPVEHSRLSALLPLFGAAFLVFACLLLGFRFYGYTTDEILRGCSDVWLSVKEGVQTENGKSGKRFGFARFENAPDGNVEIAGDAGRSIVDAARQDGAAEPEVEGEEASMSGRFENPLYSSKRSKPKAERILLDAPLALSTLKDQDGRDVDEIGLDVEE